MSDKSAIEWTDAPRVLRRVKQTLLKAPEGNCFEACLASILDCDLSEVPYHGDCPGWSTNNNEPFRRAVQDWLWARGWLLVGAGIEHHVSLGTDQRCWLDVPEGLPFIATVPSPRGENLHAVVAVISDGELLWVHDPHPAGGFGERVVGVEFVLPRAGLSWTLPLLDGVEHNGMPGGES